MRISTEMAKAINDQISYEASSANASMKQDETLRRINQLEESHDKVQRFQQHQEKLLSKILSLDKKIDAIVDTDKENELY